MSFCFFEEPPSPPCVGPGTSSKKQKLDVCDPPTILLGLFAKPFTQRNFCQSSNEFQQPQNNC